MIVNFVIDTCKINVHVIVVRLSKSGSTLCPQSQVQRKPRKKATKQNFQEFIMLHKVFLTFKFVG